MNAPYITEITDLGGSVKLTIVNDIYETVSKGDLTGIYFKSGRAFLTVDKNPNNKIGNNQYELTVDTTYNGEDFSTLAELILALSDIIGSSSGGGSSSSVSAEYKSPIDFTAAFTTASTITLSNLPSDITDSTQLVYIKVIPTTEKAAIYVNGSAGYTFRVASNVVTAYYNEDVVDIFASGDLYEVGLNLQVKAYDPTINSKMVSAVTPTPQAYTDLEALVSAQALTASYADFGSVIDMQGYNRLGVWVTRDINTSENVTMKVVGIETAAGTTEYELDGVDTVTLWTTTGSSADGSTYYEFDTGTVPFVKIKAIAGTVGTAGTLSIKINKKWRN